MIQPIANDKSYFKWRNVATVVAITAFVLILARAWSQDDWPKNAVGAPTQEEPHTPLTHR